MFYIQDEETEKERQKSILEYYAKEAVLDAKRISVCLPCFDCKKMAAFRIDQDIEIDKTKAICGTCGILRNFNEVIKEIRENNVKVGLLAR